MATLTAWISFYMVMGSSAGALIGLQFVVIALVANLPGRNVQAQGGEAFVAPTLVHFGMVLLLAGIVSSPWSEIWLAATLMCFAGFAGLIYMGFVMWRMWKHTAYKAEWEDWVFHAFLPSLAYLLLAASAAAVVAQHFNELFGVAASALLLLFTGIHNAWDNASYHVFVKKQG
jgi:hypothetical protein